MIRMSHLNPANSITNQQLFKQMYTKGGMESHNIRNEGNGYRKRGLSWYQVDKYLQLQRLGIGVPILDYSRIQGWVFTKPGKVLQKFIDNSEWIQRSTVIEELTQIYRVLRKNSIAHTDIKARNIVVCEDGHFYLIDNEYLTFFGEQRQVGTPGQNMGIFGLEMSCNEQTDLMGFRSIIQQLQDAGCFKPKFQLSAFLLKYESFTRNLGNYQSLGNQDLFKKKKRG